MPATVTETLLSRTGNGTDCAASGPGASCVPKIAMYRAPRLSYRTRRSRWLGSFSDAGRRIIESVPIYSVHSGRWNHGIPARSARILQFLLGSRVSAEHFRAPL